MKIKPLIQLRELIAAALKSQTNLSKSFQSFFKEAMELFLTIPNRINFLQMERFGHSSEQRFRMNFRKKCYDWIRFNKSFIAEGNRNDEPSPLIRVTSASPERRLQVWATSGQAALLQ